MVVLDHKTARLVTADAVRQCELLFESKTLAEIKQVSFSRSFEQEDHPSSAHLGIEQGISQSI